MNDDYNVLSSRIASLAVCFHLVAHRFGWRYGYQFRNTRNTLSRCRRCELKYHVSYFPAVSKSMLPFLRSYRTVHSFPFIACIACHGCLGSRAWTFPTTTWLGRGVAWLARGPSAQPWAERVPKQMNDSTKSGPSPLRWNWITSEKWVL